MVIVTKLNTTHDYLPRLATFIKKINALYMHLSFTNTTAQTTNGAIRAVKATDTGIEFKEASTANTYVIPLYIFGVKRFLGIDDYINGTES